MKNSYLFLTFTPLRFILPGSNLLSQYKNFGEPENFNASDMASLPEDKKGFGSDSDVTSGSESVKEQDRVVNLSLELEKWQLHRKLSPAISPS